MANIKKIIVPVNGQKAEVDFTKIDSDIQNVNSKLSKLFIKCFLKRFLQKNLLLKRF